MKHTYKICKYGHDNVMILNKILEVSAFAN